jgi:hypothetical protein
MASTIAATTGPSGALVYTADASGNLSLLSGATTIVAITNAGAAVTGVLSVGGAPVASTATSQNQTYTAFTTGGTSSAYTLTPTPALTAYAAGQRFNITLNATPSGSATLNISGLGAKNFKYYNAQGVKVFINSWVSQTNWISDVIYDGTDMVLMNVIGRASGTLSTQKAIFGYGYNGANLSMTNLVSNTGVVSTDVTGVGTTKSAVAAASYGADKAIFGFGGGGSMTNLVSNTGVVSTDVTGVGTTHYYTSAAGFSLT